jgi:hypothetical protein
MAVCPNLEYTSSPGEQVIKLIIAESLIIICCEWIFKKQESIPAMIKNLFI